PYSLRPPGHPYPCPPRKSPAQPSHAATPPECHTAANPDTRPSPGHPEASPTAVATNSSSVPQTPPPTAPAESAQTATAYPPADHPRPSHPGQHQPTPQQHTKPPTTATSHAHEDDRKDHDGKQTAPSGDPTRTSEG